MSSKRLKGKKYRQVNERVKRDKENKDVNAKHSNDKITPNAKLKCEVVVPPLLKKVSANGSPDDHVKSDESSGNDDAPRRQRRKGNEDIIVISDDSNNDDSGSDYEDATQSHVTSEGIDEDTGSENEILEDTSSDDDGPRKGKKNPRKLKQPKKGSKLNSVVNDAGKGKKRKSAVLGSDTETDESNPKKKVKKETKPKISRAKADPWKLRSTAVQKQWRKLQAPPLEIFHFHRLVIDEYTYLDGKTHSLITSLQATCRWVLSGTPPVHDFLSLKTIAVFLDIHLGIDDDGEGQSAQIKKRKREQTGNN